MMTKTKGEMMKCQCCSKELIAYNSISLGDWAKCPPCFKADEDKRLRRKEVCSSWSRYIQLSVAILILSAMILSADVIYEATADKALQKPVLSVSVPVGVSGVM
jgi:hypothetical protein